MALIRLTPPALEPVTLAEAYAHLRLDAADLAQSPPDGEAMLVRALVEAATAHLDGADGLLGRALVTQQWRLDLAVFPEGRQPLILPLPPLQAIDAVRWTDAEGVAHEMEESDDYIVSGLGGSAPARLVPISTWPRGLGAGDAVAIEFTAGFGPGPDDVPAPIRAAIKLMLGNLYEHREAVVLGAAPVVLPLAVEALLAPWRVWLG